MAAESQWLQVVQLGLKIVGGLQENQEVGLYYVLLATYVSH